MLCIVQPRYPGGARFSFECYIHSEQLLIIFPVEVELKTPLIHGGVTQWGPLSILLYGLILSFLVEYIRMEYPVFL